MPPIRLLSLNAGVIPGPRAALVELVAAQDADLVCVHALPNLVRWRQAVAAIARRAGRVVVSGGGPRSGSVLLMSTLGVDSVAVSDVRFTGPARLHPPGGTVARVRWHGVDLVVAGATLIGNSADRVAQVGELHAAIAELAPSQVPTIVSAEGTDRPGTAAWQALLGNGVAVAGRVFVDGRLGVGASRKLDENPFTAPVIVEVEVG